ncbi:MAG TPA: hypothetical protein VKN18_19870 [Blastocatellia bacterium]|nr:hypothetical protein [Blastocatellia bacterium]
MDRILELALLMMLGAAMLASPTQSPNSAKLPSEISIQQSKDLNGPVQRGSKGTYLDLLRTLFPDVKVNPDLPDEATAHQTIPIKHIGDQDEGTVFEGDFKIKEVEFRQVLNQGRALFLLLIDLTAENANEATPYEGEASVLALFSADPVKLLDALDVKTDKFTDFWGKQPISHLDSRNDYFVIHNTHFNAGESYDDYTVMSVDEGKLTVITSLFTLNTQACGWKESQTPVFRTLRMPAGKYPTLLVTVKLTKEVTSEECARRARGYTRYYRATYRWNATKARYEGDSRQLERLDKFNRDRM